MGRFAARHGASPSFAAAPHAKKFGPMPLGPLRPLRGSGFALGQPDAYGTGEFTVQPAKSPPTAPAMNGQAAFHRALASSAQSMSMFFIFVSFLVLFLTTEGTEAPAAARKRLSCPEWDSFANPFPCPQGGFRGLGMGF